MEFVRNKTKDELYKVILGIQALIDDDKEYTDIADTHVQVDYLNKINTEVLIEQVEKLREIYKLADDAYYKKGV